VMSIKALLLSVERRADSLAIRASFLTWAGGPRCKRATMQASREAAEERRRELYRISKQANMGFFNFPMRPGSFCISPSRFQH